MGSDTQPQINTDQEDVPANPDQAVQELKALKAQLSTLETYLARRFAELSMEINATSQQLDMAEEGIGRRFGEVLQTLGSISYSGDGSSPANAGVELDAVIETTEKAANTILDAAEKIVYTLGDGKIDWDNAPARQEALSDIGHNVQDILVACSFQDLTGQRIRKTLESIKNIEEDLVTTFGELGVDITRGKTDYEPKADAHASQDDIDALFAD